MPQQVYLAEPYNPERIENGRPNHMLLRQYNFPHKYTARDKLISKHHHKIDRQIASKCCVKHLGGCSEDVLGWLKSADELKVIKYLSDILSASTNVDWTGFRIMISCNKRGGTPIIMYDLFAKHPLSKTEVYSEKNAPNVLNGKRK